MLAPRKIHFIWSGNPIPIKYLREIQKLASVAKVSDFEINLWVDNPKNYEKTAFIHDVSIPNLDIRLIDSLRESMETAPFYQQKDRLRQFISAVAREKVGFANWAAHSDLIRHEILRQEGGYYFDTDIEFIINFIYKMRLIPDDLPPDGVKMIAKVMGDGTTEHSVCIMASHAGSYKLEKAIDSMLSVHTAFDKSEAGTQKFGVKRSKMDLKRFPIGNNRRYLTSEALNGCGDIYKDYFWAKPNGLFTVMNIDVMVSYDKTWLLSGCRIKVVRVLPEKKERNTLYVCYSPYIYDYTIGFFKIHKSGFCEGFFPTRSKFFDKKYLAEIEMAIGKAFRKELANLSAEAKAAILDFTESEPLPKFKAFDTLNIPQTYY